MLALNLGTEASRRCLAMSRDIWLSVMAAGRKQGGFSGKHWCLLIHRITHCLIGVIYVSLHSY